MHWGVGFVTKVTAEPVKQMTRLSGSLGACTLRIQRRLKSMCDCVTQATVDPVEPVGSIFYGGLLQALALADHPLNILKINAGHKM